MPFRAAILESQQTGLFGSGPDSYDKTVAHFNCDQASSQIDCLRGIRAEDIQSYISSENVVFPPVVNDGTYVASNSLPSIQSGKFANVPILIGTNKDEFRVFLKILGIDSNTDLVDLVLQQTGIDISGIESAVLANLSGAIKNDEFLLASR